MFINPDQTTSTARLFDILALGERLAEEGANRQVRLTSRPDMQRFFRQQAAQERLHRIVFENASAFLAPRGNAHMHRFESFVQFERLMQSACKRQDLPETLLAQQVVLEGLGDVVLERIDEGMTERGMSFSALRRALRRQEHAHHEFGIRKLEELRQFGEIDEGALRNKAAEYLAITDRALEQLTDLFACFDEDPAMYRGQLRETIPHWLRPAHL